jgi:hypothetical protein
MEWVIICLWMNGFYYWQTEEVYRFETLKQCEAVKDELVKNKHSKGTLFCEQRKKIEK